MNAIEMRAAMNYWKDQEYLTLLPHFQNLQLLDDVNGSIISRQ